MTLSHNPTIRAAVSHISTNSVADAARVPVARWLRARPRAPSVPA
jgi:hypothetical protein